MSHAVPVGWKIDGQVSEPVDHVSGSVSAKTHRERVLRALQSYESKNQ